MARVRDIVLRVTGEADDAVATFRRVLNEARQFDGTTATATIDVAHVDFDRAVANAKRELREFGRMSESARIDVDIARVQQQIGTVKRNLANLERQPPSIKVDVATRQALSQLGRLEDRLDRLARRRVEVDVDVDRGRGVGGAVGNVVQGVQTFARAGSTAVTTIAAFVAGAGRAVPILGGLARGFMSAGAGAGVAGLAFIALVPILGALLLNALIMTAGALAAVAASFLTAAAGAGVFMLALAAMAGPVVLVGIAVMERLKLVMDAVKESEEQAADQAARVRDANQQLQTSTENLSQAQARLADATTEAYRAWRDAIEDVDDALRGIERAELNEDQARLNLRRAEEELANFRRETGLTQTSLDNLFKKFTDIDFQPENLIQAIRNSPAAKALERSGEGDQLTDLQQLILNVRGAELDVQDAVDGVGDATTRAADARQRLNEFEREGIAAYEPFTGALRGVRDAQRQVRDATEAHSDALRKQGEAMARLTPQERRLAGVIRELKDALFDAFRPATRAVFGGVLDFLGDLRDFAQDSRVRSGLTRIGEAIGGVFRTIGRELRRRETREAFNDFATAAARFIRRLDSDVIRQFFRLMLRLAREALPWVLESILGIASAIGGWAGGINRSGIERFVKRVRESFEAWLELVRVFGRVIVRVFGRASDAGDDIIEGLTKILRRLDRWLEKNPDAIRVFFHKARDWAIEFMGTIEDLVDKLGGLLSLAEKLSDYWDLISGNVFRDIAESNENRRMYEGARGEMIRDLQARARAGNTYAQQALRNLGETWHAGGPVRGSGDVPGVLEAGEFVIRRSVAEAVGAGRLHALNAGRFDVAFAGGGGGIHIDNINLPPAPGHNQLGDPRHQAALLAAELRRRGGGRIG